MRVDPGHAPAVADILVDWFLYRSVPSNVGYKRKFLEGVTTTDVGLDFLRIGAMVFIADKTVLRDDTADGWTREIAATVPVSDVDRWQQVGLVLERALSFLSGDQWSFFFQGLHPYTVQAPRRRTHPRELTVALDQVTHVCLFSGGMDSLAGAVELLESDGCPAFIGHYESGLPSTFQTGLVNQLQQHYGEDRCDLRQLYLRPKHASDRQRQPLPGDRERTTRSRSFLFLASAVALAEAIALDLPIMMPENGYIGINVPLSRSRAGSLSTRTTHPRFVAYMQEILDTLGLRHEIQNPFRLMTKGEILVNAANQQLLRRLVPDSVSCSHPEAARWGGEEQGNCGACYPCLIRRAAVHAAGWSTGHIRYDALDPSDQAMLLDVGRQTGASVRAVLGHLRQPIDPFAVLRNGSIPNGEAAAFQALYERGRAELETWLRSGPTPLIP